MLAAAAIFVSIVTAAPLAAEPGQLASAPGPVERAQARTGQFELADGAIAYVPDRASAAPAPLLVLLHGAGGRPEDMIKLLRAEADERGVILLAPRSRLVTWDLLASLAAASTKRSSSRMGRKPPQPYSVDPARIDAALASLFRVAKVDPARIGIGGFSDGASYAISLGTRNPQLFRTVLAFSPGTGTVPRMVDPQQRIFVSHGRSDDVLAFDAAGAAVAEALDRRSLEVRFVPFDGRHELPDEIRKQGIDYFLAVPAQTGSTQRDEHGRI